MLDDLLSRLDRVGVHQSVAAKYCKEAAAEIRRLQSIIDMKDSEIISMGDGLADNICDPDLDEDPAMY